jgi:hypothetical protein
MTNSPGSPATSNRVFRSYALRTGTAADDAFIPAPPQPDNGDEARYHDKCGTYTKCVKQAGIGRVDLAAYKTFRKALDSGDPADFATIQLGGTRTLNGPQGGLAFDLEGLDSGQFASPPAPALASETYGTELVEMYWASLLRDVAFTDYPANPVAAQAAAELSAMGSYAGPRDASGKVTPQNLFRGRFPGETIGPYVSQFLLQPTDFGALHIDQRYTTLKAGIDFMTDATSFQQVQNGINTGKTVTLDTPAYMHDGRGLCAYTHVDVLYQAYFLAYLVMNSMNIKLNPGNPYLGSTTQNGFNTMGQPDIAATLTAVAEEALKAVWYQKWYIHLRHRPESGGAIVHLIKTGQGATIQGQLHHNVLHSQAVQNSFAKYGTYFLSQSFPEGSPAHPAYPTGHGTVAGACITVLKFFFDGNSSILNPQVSSSDGTTLNNYTGPDAGLMTVNGELHKLASNVSFGHGIHAAIHWRSDTDTSLELGEAVALSVLQDRARTYNEKFTANLTKLDGTTATISNE